MNTPDIDNPLYASYRRAVLGRNDEAALLILKNILAANPADANAAAELDRLDAKVLAARLQQLSASIAGGDPKKVVAEVEAIEAFGFKTRLAGDVWRQAQTIRCGELLDAAAKLKESARWADALAKTVIIRRLENDFKLELTAEFTSQLKFVETWAQEEKEKDKKEREFQSLLTELNFRIHQSEEKDTSARYVELPELKDDYEELHKIWRSLTDFTRPIPAESAAAFKKRSALLEAEIYRRNAIRRRMIVAGSVAVLLVIVAVAWFVAAQMRERNFSRQLQQAMAQRQVHTAEALLDDARRRKMGNANVLAAAETFVARENGLLQNFQAAFKQLPQTFPDEPDAARLSAIADELSLTRDDLNQLAPDLKTANQPQLQAFEQNWQNYLSQSSDTVNALLEHYISAAENECALLDYNSPLPKVRQELAALSEILQKADDCEAGYQKNIQLRDDLLQRLAAVRDKFSAYQGELAKIDNGKAALQKATTAAEFSQGIKLLASSEFSTDPAVAAATATASLDPNPETALRYLLDATNAATWSYIQKQPSPDFIPGVVMPAERRILEELDKDPAVSADHQHYRFWLDSQGSNTVEWITDGALDTSTGWKSIPAWTVSATATVADFTSHDYGFFDGQCKLSPTQPVFHIDQLNAPDETVCFHASGLDTLLSNNDTYTKSLLAVLDSIKNSQEGSSLFRAYLFSQLVNLMDLRPDSWGLTFCPALLSQDAQITALVRGNLTDGDWFVPSKVAALAGPLDQLFLAARPISYEKQAAGLLSLPEAVSKDGLPYAGFIGLDGKPHFLEGTHPSEYWGYSSTLKEPVLLGGINHLSAAQVMPLSPLFTTVRPRAEYLGAAGVNANDPSFHNVLPPLFENPTPEHP